MQYCNCTAYEKIVNNVSVYSALAINTCAHANRMLLVLVRSL